MTSDSNVASELLERIIPYEISQHKSSLYSLLNDYPQLREIFEERVTSSKDWVNNSLKSEKIYFCINNSFWKRKNTIPTPTLEVEFSFIQNNENKDKVPVIHFNVL